MEVLELQLSVPGHSTLDQSTRISLMTGEAFRPLPHTMQMALLEQVAPNDWMTVLVQECAVFVADDWVISIHGEKLIHCVSAMSVLLNSIGQELGTTISIEVLTQLNDDGEPLHRVLERQARNDRVKGYAKTGLTLLAGGFIGGFISLLLTWVFSGGL